jgi:hypothetical protein
LLQLADLLLLKRNLASLSEVPYFDERIIFYIEDLILVVQHCIDNHNTLNILVIDKIINYIWSSYNHLSGTTTKNIPYEMEYLLNKAISSWIKQPFIITMAVSNDKMAFYCWNLNVLEEISTLIGSLNFKTIDLLIVQITMPSFYTKIPLYTIPMYHEIGHFIDNLYNISQTATLNALGQIDVIPHMRIQNNLNVDTVSNHMAEYFCDLFASCYIGDTISRFLNSIAPNFPNSTTHPATMYRGEVIGDFLSGHISNPIILNIQHTLVSLNLSQLSLAFVIPDIHTALSEVETYKITNDLEAHGILVAYWNHIEADFGPPISRSFQENFHMNNDIIIKSIRNYSIRERWSK